MMTETQDEWENAFQIDGLSKDRVTWAYLKMNGKMPNWCAHQGWWQKPKMNQDKCQHLDGQPMDLSEAWGKDSRFEWLSLKCQIVLWQPMDDDRGVCPRCFLMGKCLKLSGQPRIDDRATQDEWEICQIRWQPRMMTEISKMNGKMPNWWQPVTTNQIDIPSALHGFTSCDDLTVVTTFWFPSSAVLKWSYCTICLAIYLGGLVGY